MNVLQQIYKRQAEHELNNAKNKLTPAQRSEKGWLKRQEKEKQAVEGTGTGTRAGARASSLHVSAFVVNTIIDTKTIVKMLRDANQWFLTGCIVHCLDNG